MELSLLFGLLVKHAICDIGLQRYIKRPNKQIYSSKKAQIHYLQHGVGTFLICLFFVGPLTALIAGALDWVAHWHIDHTKARVNEYFGWNSTHKAFWWMVSIDQILHYLTYYIIIVLI